MPATVQEPYLDLPVIESTYTCTIGETTNSEHQAAAIADVAFPVLWTTSKRRVRGR
jgi:hypothetical protein